MPDQDWQKSTFSGAHDECVEIRTVDGAVELRESDDPGVIVHTESITFANLLQAIKAGELDHHT
ncbi:DUF397 domain-containing protein [Kitasatospora sp. NPDC002965]|uniref:DUF397 domain-containing protein n=1 Tax=Kitasatospora sp. NPDC002965 TaxID=3154775 RepID=UPI00339DDDA3